MKAPEKNWLEWVVFAISAMLILSTLGYLSYDAVTQTNAPASIIVQLGEPMMGERNVMVPVAVMNEGNETVENVQVEVVWSHGDTQERSEFIIDLLPRHATREGWATFSGDPQVNGRLQSQVLGYQRP
jgi:uncharacterized protein (TIGR02588 family)